MKKIWLLCLCLASLGLAGCFHIPDEDWLPSRNKVNTWDTQRDKEMEDALNDIMDWINMVSSQRDQLDNGEIEDEKGDENTDINGDEEDISEETIDNNETIDNEESNNSEDTVDIEHIDQETDENIISEE